ncbi:MAG: hypothetical protein HYR55_16395 [Acidobacteria bacterium]|nr:hypothetical protein [Acidobacteriota bacterium]MBI3658132.1 hypothetical protein [Acidobacteriota bacterium]
MRKGWIVRALGGVIALVFGIDWVAYGQGSLPPIRYSGFTDPYYVTTRAQEYKYKFYNLLVTADGVLTQSNGVIAEGTITTKSVLSTAAGAPRGIKIDITGFIYVVDQSQSAVLKIAPSGTVTRFATVDAQAEDLERDYSGNTYVSGQSGTEGVVYKIDPQGNVQMWARGLIQPIGLALAVDGATIYVADLGDATIYRLNPDGTKVVFRSGFPGVSDIEFDTYGNLYVAYRPEGSGDIGKVALIYADGTQTIVVDGLGQPTGLAINLSDELYLVDKQTGTIYEWSASQDTANADGDLQAQPQWGRSADKVALNWSDVPDAVRYIVYRATSAKGPYQKIQTIVAQIRENPEDGTEINLLIPRMVDSVDLSTSDQYYKVEAYNGSNQLIKTFSPVQVLRKTAIPPGMGAGKRPSTKSRVGPSKSNLPKKRSSLTIPNSDSMAKGEDRQENLDSPAVLEEAAASFGPLPYNQPFISNVELTDSSRMSQADLLEFLIRKNSFLVANPSFLDVDGTTINPVAEIYAACAQDRDPRGMVFTNPDTQMPYQFTINPQVALVHIAKEYVVLARRRRPDNNVLRFIMGWASPSATMRDQIRQGCLQMRRDYERLVRGESTRGNWRCNVARATTRPESITVTPANIATTVLLQYTTHVGPECTWRGIGPEGGNSAFYKYWAFDLGFGTPLMPIIQVSQADRSAVDPDFALDSQGYFHIVWTVQAPLGATFYAKLDSAGTITIPPRQIYAINGLAPRITTDAQSNAHIMTYLFNTLDDQRAGYTKIDPSGQIAIQRDITFVQTSYQQSWPSIAMNPVTNLPLMAMGVFAGSPVFMAWIKGARFDGMGTPSFFDFIAQSPAFFQPNLYPDIVVDSSQGAHSVWRNQTGFAYGRGDSTATQIIATTPGSGGQAPRLAIDSAGKRHLAFSANPSGTYEVSYYSFDYLQTPLTVQFSSMEGPSFLPHLSVNANPTTNVHLVWQNSPAGRDYIRYGNLNFKGNRWEFKKTLLDIEKGDCTTTPRTSNSRWPRIITSPDNRDIYIVFVNNRPLNPQDTTGNFRVYLMKLDNSCN